MIELNDEVNYFKHYLSYLSCVQFAKTEFCLYSKKKKQTHPQKNRAAKPMDFAVTLDVQLRET